MQKPEKLTAKKLFLQFHGGKIICAMTDANMRIQVYYNPIYKDLSVYLKSEEAVWIFHC